MFLFHMSIELSSKLYDLLIQYKNSNKTYAANRKSLLMLFTFYEPSNNYVTLERVVDNHLTKIPTYEPDQVIGYELVSNRFIHHERADAFIPGERIQWKLTEGRNVWVLSTSAPP